MLFARLVTGLRYSVLLPVKFLLLAALGCGDGRDEPAANRATEISQLFMLLLR